jgi:hypothetical protein
VLERVEGAEVDEDRGGRERREEDGGAVMKPD